MDRERSGLWFLPPNSDDDQLTVKEIVARFWEHAERVYRPLVTPKAGTMPSGELGNFACALRPLRRLYGETPAFKFGPLALKHYGMK